MSLTVIGVLCLCKTNLRFCLGNDYCILYGYRCNCIIPIRLDNYHNLVTSSLCRNFLTAIVSNLQLISTLLQTGNYAVCRMLPSIICYLERNHTNTCCLDRCDNDCTLTNYGHRLIILGLSSLNSHIISSCMYRCFCAVSIPDSRLYIHRLSVFIKNGILCGMCTSIIDSCHLPNLNTRLCLGNHNSLSHSHLYALIILRRLDNCCHIISSCMYRNLFTSIVGYCNRS